MLHLFIAMRKFQLITSPHCGPCTIFKVQLQSNNLINHVELIELHSAEGQDLVQEHKLKTVPACLVDNQLVNQSTFVAELKEVELTS